MNIVVIGLGSMGKRRVRLIREMYPDYCIYGVDGREDRRKEADEQLNIKCVESLAQIQDRMDCAFVCTSPLSHASVIAECLTNGWHVFTELNLVDDGYDRNIRLAKERGCKLFLSSTFLYREEIKYIRSKIRPDLKWNYIYHIGQYLPDWHPWENYKDFFVGYKRTNGCREIMAIELPWITEIFGSVKDTQAVSDKMSNLDIGYRDNFMVQFIHENGNKGIFVADVVSPYAVRKLEIYSEGNYISWGGTPESLWEFHAGTGTLERVCLNEKAEHRKGYRAFVVEDAYKNEIKEFFEAAAGNRQPLYGFEQDQKILKLIDSLGA